MKKQILKQDGTLESITNKKPRLFRPLQSHGKFGASEEDFWATATYSEFILLREGFFDNGNDLIMVKAVNWCVFEGKWA